MGNILTVVGIGPGSPDYLLPAAQKAIDSAAVLVGSRRALAMFARRCPETRVIDKDLNGVFQFIAAKLVARDVVVMVSGDPGFNSLLAALRTRFPPEIIKVIPGLSSFQLAFARIGEVWQDAVLVSMHGREADSGMLTCRPGKKLAILTDDIHNPADIAAQLLAAGWPPASKVWLCSRLSYEDEHIEAVTLAAAAALQCFNHSIMVVIA